MSDMWKLCELNWSPQAKVTITAAIVNLLNTIWFVRNQCRFNQKLITWRAAISLIISSTAIAGNQTGKVSSNAMRDFTFLKLFNINIHQPKVPILREVIWQPPLLNWVKCNIDGASCGNPGLASCGGVFRDVKADFLLAFTEPLGFESSLYAELCGAFRAIEIAFDKNWLNLWLESDSSLVVNAFNSPSSHSIAWPLRNRWNNVLVKMRHMNCLVTHVFREGNKVADLVANFGLHVNTFTTWSSAPDFLSASLACNKLGLPNFRLCVT